MPGLSESDSDDSFFATTAATDVLTALATGFLVDSSSESESELDAFLAAAFGVVDTGLIGVWKC